MMANKKTHCTCKSCRKAVLLDETSVRAHLKQCRPEVAAGIKEEYLPRIKEARERAA